MLPRGAGLLAPEAGPLEALTTLLAMSGVHRLQSNLSYKPMPPRQSGQRDWRLDDANRQPPPPPSPEVVPPPTDSLSTVGTAQPENSGQANSGTMMINRGGRTGLLSSMPLHHYPIEPQRKIISSIADVMQQQITAQQQLAQTAQTDWNTAEGAANTAVNAQPASMRPEAELMARLGGGISQALDPRMGGQQAAENFIGDTNQSLRQRQAMQTQRLVDKANRLAMRAERMGDQVAAQKHAAEAWKLEQGLALEQRKADAEYQSEEARIREQAAAERAAAIDERRTQRSEETERRKSQEDYWNTLRSDAQKRYIQARTLLAAHDKAAMARGAKRNPAARTQLQAEMDAAYEEYQQIDKEAKTNLRGLAQAYGDDPKVVTALYGDEQPTAPAAAAAGKKDDVPAAYAEFERRAGKRFATEQDLIAAISGTYPPGTGEHAALLQEFRKRRGRSPRKVARTIDGDTIVLDDSTHVRLQGVDTPETHHPTKPAQYYGRQAEDWTRNRLASRSPDIQLGPRDKYGRRLGYAWFGDTLVNQELIDQGYAEAYRADVYPEHRQFLLAEARARARRYGMWAHPESLHVAVRR